MGLFDKLLDRAKKEVGGIMADTISQKTGAILNGQGSTSETLLNGQPVQGAGSAPTGRRAEDNRPFDAKLTEVLQRIGDFEVRRGISPDTLEQEFSTQIYQRGGCFSLPEDFSYVLYQGQNRVLIIRLWNDYQVYNHKANRVIKYFCEQKGIRILDFFDYFRNDTDYMENRIRDTIG